MKKIRAAAAVTALCLALSGCSSLSLTIPDVMSPPQAQGDQAQVQKLIEKTAGDNYEMLYPSDGENKSAVVFYDSQNNEDNYQKALAFYTCDEDSVRVLCAEKSSDRFETVGEAELPCTDISRVDFADIDGNGTQEAVIGYTMPDAHYISVTVLVTNTEVQKENLSFDCSAYQIGDFNADGCDDILILSPSTPDSIALARLMLYGEDGFYEQSSCEIDPDVTEYTKLIFGRFFDEQVGAVIDCKDTSSLYGTQILYYDAEMETIFNPLYSVTGYQKTKRSSSITSGDVNYDEVIEIPLCAQMDYGPREEQSTVCEQISWCGFSLADYSFSTVKASILCDRLGFLFHLSEDKIGLVTARYTGENMMSLYLWEYKDDEPTRSEELLCIKRYDKDSFDPAKIPEAVICQASGYVYTYIVYTDTGYPSFSDEEVTDSFVLLDN